MPDSKSASLRYGGGKVDPRNALLRLAAKLQRRKIVVLDSDPQFCGKVLASSKRKGTFIEHLVAIPAWQPIHSIESVDGELWAQLAGDFRKLMAELAWRERLAPLVQKYFGELALEVAENPQRVIDSPTLSRLVVRVLFELIFDAPLNRADETLFFQASLEWRKEIAVKGPADTNIKRAFIERLQQIVEASRFRDGLVTYQVDPMRWLSLFAQPLLISPQINLSDIFVALFHFLREAPERMRDARQWAQEKNRPLLEGMLLESIRLRHPFPILERELTDSLSHAGAHYPTGTQFMIVLDRFRQDQTFQPQRWLLPPSENPYSSIPFAAGPRMCVGKPIAMELMVEMTQQLLVMFPEQAIQPQQQHLYSGRDNDESGGVKETFYQLKVFARVLRASLALGMRRKQH